MDKLEDALEKFKKGFNCAQCVILAFNNELGLSTELASKITSGFGGGMCQGEVCGAVTGAVMVLNIKYGNSNSDDNKSKEMAYEKVRKFSEEFKNINGSIICRDLLGCDLNKEGVRKYAKDKGLFKKICPKLIKDAINILDNIL